MYYRVQYGEPRFERATDACHCKHTTKHARQALPLRPVDRPTASLVRLVGLLLVALPLLDEAVLGARVRGTARQVEPGRFIWTNLH